MTQKITISNVEGPYTVELNVWEELVTASTDGPTVSREVKVETITLLPNQCASVLIWRNRNITITEQQND